MGKMAVIAVLSFFAAFVSSAEPIAADPSVEPLTLSSLQESGAASELWHALDSAGFWEVPRTIPEGYYDAIRLESRHAFRTSLHEIIKGHRVFRYTHSSRPGQGNHTVDTWDIIALADEHPGESGRVLDIYLNGTFSRQLAGSRNSFRYDREHSWPKSLGFNKDSGANPAYSDCHHLFAAYQPYNSSRSNKAYGDASEDQEADPETRRSTLVNLGRGGPDSSSNYSVTGLWETRIGRRGDVARAMFYMDVRYDGDTEGEHREADLQLTDTLADVTKKNDAWMTGAVAYMGLRKALLQWHKDDPVDDLERRRNNIVFLFQGNRNPFVDHPEWVGVVFGNAPLPSTNAAASGGLIWINEFHYDDSGADEGEFVEIAGPAGTDLKGWSILAYNGSNGLKYRTLELSGVIDNENNSGNGALSFGFVGLQNGPADGLCLVSPQGAVAQFISYEGTLSAGDGPAVDEASDDVGVSESKTTEPGQSLQLRGQGKGYEDFRWVGPVKASPGTLNQGQAFGQ